MKSTGEVMAIGRCFEEAFLKAWASLEYDQPHPRPLTMADASGGESMDERAFEPLPEALLEDWLRVPTDRRMGALFEAFRRGYSIEDVRDMSGGITRWFLHRFENMAAIETEIRAAGEIGLPPAEVPEAEMRLWKGAGFTDLHIADALAGFPARGFKLLSEGANEFAVTRRRHQLGVHPVFRMVDSCAAEFAAVTPYYYTTYEGGSAPLGIDYVPGLEESLKQRIVVIGSGPIRIGQGIEFDYGCVHAVGAIRDLGHEAIIINNNPETVSTDFDTSDRLYFDPLTLEAVSEILLRERAHGILLQFGGQTAINLALPLADNLTHLSTLGLHLMMEGTTPDTIDEASDRERFEAFAVRNGLRMPRGLTASTPDGVRKAAHEIGYPVLIRPSYVLGGRGMEILSNDKQLEAYMEEAYLAPDRPLLID
jgi:carbamoyl-phosphate synthase large subunit